MVNCYAEKAEDGQWWIYKRPGILSQSQPSGGAASGFGMFNWLGNIYSIFGNKLYKDGSAITGTVDTSNGVYRFDQCLGGTPKLQLGNGVKAYNYDDGAGLVLINDLDFPAAFRKGWAYLDGTTYVLKANAHLQGSDFNDPTSWDVLNDILVQIEPDQGVALTKQLVYAVALKQWETEFFYDAGNPTGSPLGPVQGAKIDYGCLSQDSVQRMDGALLWLSTNRSSGVQVVMVDNLKVEVVSTKPVERLLDEIDYTTIFSWTLKHDGHKFYVITSKVSNLTLAYDVAEKTWWQWTDNNGNYFPIVASTYNSSLQHLLQHETDGRIYLADSAYLTDNGTIITADIYPPQFDGGTSRRKHLGMMKFIGDQTSGSTLQVRHNDADYNAARWTNFRNVDLGQSEPLLPNCGTFKKRAFHFRHQCNTAMRIKAVDLQMDLGTL